MYIKPFFFPMARHQTKRKRKKKVNLNDGIHVQCFRLNRILMSPWDPVPLKKLGPIEFLLSPISSSVNHLFNEDYFGWGIE